MSRFAAESPFDAELPAGYGGEERRVFLDWGIKRAGIPATVLDVGCGRGLAGQYLKSLGARVVGVEIVPEFAEEARGRLDRVVVGDIERLDAAELGEGYDCIVYGDVIEHLQDPWSVLKRHRPLLSAKGYVLASIPNVRCKRALLPLLLHATWRYEASGILDRTHLRFFAYRDVLNLFAQAGFKVVAIERRLDKPQHRVLSALSCGLLRDFLALQFFVLACPIG